MNETVLPDEYLRTWQLAFIIRHPALVCPSWYRAHRALKKVYPIGSGSGTSNGISRRFLRFSVTLRWTRMLYDWCVSQAGHAPPIILDANDLIHNQSSVVKFCELTGLDPTALKFEWESEASAGDGDAPQDRASKQQSRRQEAHATMASTLLKSSRVVKEKAPKVVDIDSEADKRKHEFGDEEASFMLEVVREVMPDYEFRRQRRLV